MVYTSDEFSTDVETTAETTGDTEGTINEEAVKWFEAGSITMWIWTGMPVTEYGGDMQQEPYKKKCDYPIRSCRVYLVELTQAQSMRLKS